MSKRCTLCHHEVSYFFTQKVLNKYDVQYFRCTHCDLVQTESPFWLGEAYSSTLSNLDTGCISRNLFCVRLTLFLAYIFALKPTSYCLDYGGGHGIFVRMMRDQGLNFHWHDKYGENIFSRGFEGKTSEKYRLVTCFEVFEHLVNVEEELNQLFFPRHDFILVGTVLHNKQLNGWWYYLPESGQHISFFSKHSMDFISDKFGYFSICTPCYTLLINKNIHLSKWRVYLAKQILEGAKLTGLLSLLIPKKDSLSWTDHLELRKRFVSDKQEFSQLS
jgi:hypothetical protein